MPAARSDTAPSSPDGGRRRSRRRPSGSDLARWSSLVTTRVSPARQAASASRSPGARGWCRSGRGDIDLDSLDAQAEESVALDGQVLLVGGGSGVPDKQRALIGRTSRRWARQYRGARAARASGRSPTPSARAFNRASATPRMATKGIRLRKSPPPSIRGDQIRSLRAGNGWVCARTGDCHLIVQQPHLELSGLCCPARERAALGCRSGPRGGLQRPRLRYRPAQPSGEGRARSALSSRS